MILQGNLNCCDNSGAKKVKLIKTLNVVSQNNSLSFGQSLKVIITQCSQKNNKVKKGSLTKGIIINLRKNKKRFDLSYTKFDTSSVILLNNKNDCIGSRIFAPIPIEIRKKNFLKFIFLSTKII